MMDNEFERSDMGAQPEGAGTAARMKQTVKDAASQASEKISDLGRKTVDQLDSTRQPIASTLDKTASALHEQGDTAAKAAHTTADKLQSSAEYVRQHDVQAMMSDVQELAKRYPGQCLAAAVGFGFLLGRLFRNSD
jgi:ElaB/YqjD/DUF883 family membrane-anchored ribosome-binding protein